MNALADFCYLYPFTLCYNFCRMQIRIVNDTLTFNGEVEPRAIVSRTRSSIGEDHSTFIPALVAFANIREVYTTLAESTMIAIVQ